MSKPILVAYTTLHGSTQEVAEAVAAELRQAGLSVDFQLLGKVRSLKPYGAVVIGAPLYMFHWHKDALNFFKRHRAELISRPVAIFALGPFHDEEQEWQDVRAQLDKDLAKFPWLNPVAVQIFGGKFDPQTLRLPYRLIPALKQMPPSDIRDWVAIRAWANDLAGRFLADEDGAA